MPPSYDAGGSRSSLYYARLSKCNKFTSQVKKALDGVPRRSGALVFADPHLVHIFTVVHQLSNCAPCCGLGSATGENDGLPIHRASSAQKSLISGSGASQGER